MEYFWSCRRILEIVALTAASLSAFGLGLLAMVGWFAAAEYLFVVCSIVLLGLGTALAYLARLQFNFFRKRILGATKVPFDPRSLIDGWDISGCRMFRASLDLTNSFIGSAATISLFVIRPMIVDAKKLPVNAFDILFCSISVASIYAIHRALKMRNSNFAVLEISPPVLSLNQEFSGSIVLTPTSKETNWFDFRIELRAGELTQLLSIDQIRPTGCSDCEIQFSGAIPANCHPTSKKRGTFLALCSETERCFVTELPVTL